MLLHDSEVEQKKDIAYDFKGYINLIWAEHRETMGAREMRNLLTECVTEYFAFGVEGKYCTKCKTTKVIGEFGVDKSKPDGLFYWCRACRRKRNEDLGLPPSV